MKPNTDNKLWPLVNFDTFEKQLNGESKSSLHGLRKKALSRFQEKGFPTQRHEEWRFTNISPIQQGTFELAEEGQVTTQDTVPYLLKNATLQLVFVNGYFREDLSKLDPVNGVRVMNLARAIRENPDEIKQQIEKHETALDREFSALNTAFFRDGAYIQIDDNALVEGAIHLVYFTITNNNSIVTHPRNLIIAGKNSQATIMESYVGWNLDSYFTNPVTDIFLGENAAIDHYKLQRESEKAYHIATQHIYQARDSRLVSYSFSIGGSIVRNDIHNVLDGEGCDTVLNGLYLAHNQQLVDTHSVIDHAKPHCHSREIYHGILDDHARSVFSGKIHVRQDAQKTDAIQSNKNIMLSENATIDTQPQLEIFADDVRCTHGGTVGQIDENGVFYLRSRGIDKTKARNMMIHAFAGEIFNEVKIDSVRELMDELVLSHLQDGHLKHKE